MLTWILSFLSGPLRGISSDIKEAYTARLNAENDKEKIAAEERITLLEGREAIILRAMSDRFERWIRIGFALPFVIYIAKVILWDKVLGIGTTDALSSSFLDIMYIVLAGYFLDTITGKVFKR